MSDRELPWFTVRSGTYRARRPLMADGVTEPYSGGMSEPAYEMTLEELADSPHLWGEALRSVARGRVVHLVQGDHEHVADIVPDGALEELEETVEVLADSEAVRALIEAREAAARGDVVRGADAVRALLNERRDSAV